MPDGPTVEGLMAKVGRGGIGLGGGSLQDILDALALTTTVVPGVGDAVGAVADGYRYATDPESRTWGNAALTGIGLVPFVPAMGGVIRHLPSGQAVADIMETLASSRQSHKGHSFGLRVIPEGEVKPGDILPPSRHWVNGEPTERVLSGTSAVSVGRGSEDDIALALRRMGADQEGRRHYYPGDRVALVAGKRAGRGQDAGEVKLKDATVLSVWRKQSGSSSPIVGREY